MVAFAALSCGGAPAKVPPPAVRAQASASAPAATSVLGRAAHSAPAGAPVAQDAKRVELRSELRGRHFPLPLVHGTVSGTPRWMLVDAGANSHVVAGWRGRRGSA